VKHDTLVTAATLEQHLGEWAVVDCRFDLREDGWGLNQYLAAHIPSAAYASLSRDLSGPVNGTNGRHPLPEIGEFAATLGRLGIDGTTQVVVYDQDIGMYAARLWWMLRYAGHRRTAVLDGGWQRWMAEGRPVREGRETPPEKTFVASPRPELLASLGDVIDVSNGGGGLLVDARAPERFDGRSETLDRAAGHIPGATNRFYKENVTPEGEMLPRAALKTAYERALGGRTPRETVMYCGSGVTACHNLLAMEHAGLRGARLYVGSWSEWSADPTRRVATGS
jgi:thiosulfate/3-mercaptopyruvate sulfurtransferase